MAVPGTAAPTADSPVRWRQVRRELNQHRHHLASIADGLYPGVCRVGNSPLLCRPEWLPARPVPLDQLALTWTEHPPLSAVDGTEQITAHLRPIAANGQRYRSYADALAAIDPPKTFENRQAYRLVAADLTSARGPGLLELSAGRYFDGVNTTEAVSHELAQVWRENPGPIRMDRLPYREAIGDPCGLSRRPAGVAVATLTIRRPTRKVASFLLHWRDPERVAHGGGLYQVIPVGIFQPADHNPASVRNDLSLWRCMAREFSEELLGTSEEYADLGSPMDYHRWPFYRDLCAARDAGLLRVFCLGLGVDALTLAIDILTVAVFDGDTFDGLFDGLVTVNAEGRVLSSPGDTIMPGMPFTSDTIGRFTSGREPIQPVGAAMLELGWNYRETLLG